MPRNKGAAALPATHASMHSNSGYNHGPGWKWKHAHLWCLIQRLCRHVSHALDVIRSKNRVFHLGRKKRATWLRLKLNRGTIVCPETSSSSSSCSWRFRRFLLLDPQDVVGPSISSTVVLRSFVPLVYIVVLVLIVYLCPSSVRVVATFSGTVLFPLLCSVLPVFPLIHCFFSLSSFVIPSKCLKNFICASSKRCSSLFLSTQTSLPNFNAALAVILWILNFVSLLFVFQNVSV